MTVEIITTDDLPQSVRDAVDPAVLAIMVAGANARAARVAPCLISTDPAPSQDQLAEAKLILIGALSRWSQAGSGAVQQQTAGPFSMSTDTRQRTGYNLWPSEIEDLAALCAEGSSEDGAFAIDTAPGSAIGPHLPWCAWNMGALYCSCGVTIAGEPIYELG